MINGKSLLYGEISARNAALFYWLSMISDSPSVYSGWCCLTAWSPSLPRMLNAMYSQFFNCQEKVVFALLLLRQFCEQSLYLLLLTFSNFGCFQIWADVWLDEIHMVSFSPDMTSTTISSYSARNIYGFCLYMVIQTQDSPWHPSEIEVGCFAF